MQTAFENDHGNFWFINPSFLLKKKCGVVSFAHVANMWYFISTDDY